MSKRRAQTVSNAEIDQFLQALGQAMSDWGEVEEGLFDIFFRVLGARALGPAACTFIAAENARAKIAIVDSIIRHSKRTRPFLSEWKGLLDRCDKMRAARNQLAHRKVVVLQIGRAKPRPALVKYRHDIRHMLKDEFEIPSWLGLAHLEDLSKKFRKLGADLSRFQQTVSPVPTS
jgi:hypothetical protein